MDEKIAEISESSKRPLESNVTSNPSKKRRRRGKKSKKSNETRETTSELVEEAKSYLELWSENRVSWKFRKAKQAWILRWMYHTQYVNKEMFKLVLPYLTGLQVYSVSLLFSLSLYLSVFECL